MEMLRLGSNGSDVATLQGALRRYTPDLAIDGIFGPRTERAVRLVQRRHGLYPPDGIAGPMTMGTLGSLGKTAPPTRHVAVPATRSAAFQTANAAAREAVPGTGDPGPLRHAIAPARERARTGAMPSGTASPVAGMSTSRFGRRFIYSHEAQAGVSNRLHHPSSGSGVTIGPGYDMKDRTPAAVTRDLMAARVPADAAQTAGGGAGLSGKAAGTFVHEHRATLNLSPDQQQELLTHILPHYEAMVKRAVRVPLHQHEFDGLVSYAYNPGGGWRRTTALINAGKPHEAMVEIKRHVTSGGKRIKSLVDRRAAESRVFLYGEYR